MRIKLSRLADAEIEEAHKWYDGREPGLGAAFRAELAATIHRIVERPEAFAIVVERMRRVMLKRFPYFLVYEVFPDAVIVFGVIHGARDPHVWMRRSHH